MRIFRMSVLASLALVLIAAPTIALAGKVLLRTQVLYPTNLPLAGEGEMRLANLVQTMSNGEVEFKLFDPGKIVPSNAILDSVSQGRIQAGMAISQMWAGKMAAASLFAGGPFGPEAPELVAWMLAGNGLKLYQEMYDEAGYNVKVIPFGLTPPESSGWFRKKIDSPDQLKGLKVRYLGLGGLVLQKLGASVSSFPPAEIFSAMDKGLLDAAEFAFPSLDQAIGLNKVAKFNYYPGWHQPSTTTEVLINKDVWEKRLTESQRTIIETASKASMLWVLAKGEATQASALRLNAEKHGVTNLYWSNEMLQAFRGAWDEVVAEQCAKDAFFKKVWDDLSSFRDNYSIWKKFAYLPRETGASD
ncbi:MAG: TRAP transporter substrate-binding protein [Deltaproteobacteria bacterium]|nr:TRAP transporter substrate-binding protein [Deltaproteobacteria bacterium]